MNKKILRSLNECQKLAMKKEEVVNEIIMTMFQVSLTLLASGHNVDADGSNV